MANVVKFWPVLQRLLKYGIPWKKLLIIASLLLLIASIAEVLGPILISYFIHNILEQQCLNIKLIISIIITLIILQIIASSLHYFQTILFSKIAINIVQKLRSEVIDAALQQPMSVFDNQQIGQIISRVTNDTEVIKELYDTVIVTVFRSITLITVILIAMFTLEWRMALISITIFPFIITVMFIYQHYSIPILRNVRYHLANINNKFNEIINGMDVIQQFSQQHRFQQSIHNTCQEHYNSRMQTLKLDGFLLRPLLSLYSAIILSSLMILFSMFPMNFFEVGVLYAFINYLGRLNEPLIAITTQQSILQQAIVAGERIFELIDAPQQYYGTDLLPLKTGKIEIKKLNFKYKKNETNNILNNINISIPSKSFYAFVGYTGSGKSTLANILMGYYPIDEGEIYLDNRLLHSLSHEVLRNNISMVQQDPIILADTFMSNITLGKNIQEEQVWNILKQVKLDQLARSMKNGIHSLLGEQGNNLSVGQKQLLSIARILISHPKILILDEATANIDSETEKNIQEAIKLIQKQTTLIVIAHRLSTIIEADKIIVFNKGCIVESGTHNQLIKKQGRYWEMYKLQLNNLSKKDQLNYKY
ncbi:Multidrug resistance-like ATP-binding protein MdlB [Buchnera aphidicola (Eriosoma lanigerum)]|uniref:SmdB family multidrug efflux ABC transporter permease/ATP-binding protein n=1 Tax=Buchnera aphidicola TaxID=9 RepID=UPI003463ED37